jgi:hypothetical protein
VHPRGKPGHVQCGLCKVRLGAKERPCVCHGRIAASGYPTGSGEPERMERPNLVCRLQIHQSEFRKASRFALSVALRVLTGLPHLRPGRHDAESHPDR